MGANMNRMERVWIVGAGAVGSVLAARLQHARPGTVTLIDSWAEHVAAIREGGLTVDYSGEPLHVDLEAFLYDDVADVAGLPDLVVLAVKAYQSQEALEAIVPHIAEAPILSLQNAINEEAIAEAVGADRTIGGVCLYDAGLVGPGQARQAMKHGKVVIGELDGQIGPRIEAVAGRLRESTPVRVTDNIWGELWTKLIRNAMVNGIAAVMNLGMGELVKVEGCEAICIGLGSEAVRVALAMGHRLLPADLFDCAFQYPIEWYLEGPGTPERAKLEVAFRESWLPHPSVFPSMLQDLRKGRRTEVDGLNGYVAARGAQLGIPTPANAALTTLIHQCSDSGRFPTHQGVLDTLLPLVT
jgi:2-dehydropantoate 2-reductase